MEIARTRTTFKILAGTAAIGGILFAGLSANQANACVSNCGVTASVESKATTDSAENTTLSVTTAIGQSIGVSVGGSVGRAAMRGRAAPGGQRGPAAPGGQRAQTGLAAGDDAASFSAWATFDYLNSEIRACCGMVRDCRD